MDLQKIADVASKCTSCNLHTGRNKAVFAKGSEYADIMICGMVPGPEENKVGLPFVGRAGQLLDIILSKVGSPVVYITNMVKCALAPGIPLKEEWIASCISYLISQIYIVKPKVILTLGADATNALLGLPLDTKIGGLRGQVQNYSDEVFVIPTYHPSYLLRGGGEQHKHFDIVVGDFSLACITAEKNL